MLKELPYRALTIGLVLVLTISIGAPYSIWIIGSSEITWSVFPIGVGVPFILLVLANALLKRLYAPWALAPFELLLPARLSAIGYPPRRERVAI